MLWTIFVILLVLWLLHPGKDSCRIVLGSGSRACLVVASLISERHRGAPEFYRV
jgi:hypothetical protein